MNCETHGNSLMSKRGKSKKRPMKNILFNLCNIAAVVSSFSSIMIKSVLSDLSLPFSLPLCLPDQTVLNEHQKVSSPTAMINQHYSVFE